MDDCSFHSYIKSGYLMFTHIIFQRSTEQEIYAKMQNFYARRASLDVVGATGPRRKSKLQLYHTGYQKELLTEADN